MPGAAVEQATLESRDGHRFDVTLRARPSTGQPVLVFFPALGTASRFYAHFADALAAHGIACCTFDWRGMASSNWRAARRCDFGYRHLVEFDAPVVLDFVRQRRPAAPLWVGGHSLGGQLSALLAASEPGLCGLVAIASGCVFLPCFAPPLRAQIRLLGLVSEVAGFAVGHFPGRRFGFGGREARGVMRDWLHVARTGRYRPAGSAIDYEQQLDRAKQHVLALNFTADSWAPAAAAQYLLDKMPRCHREHWVWDAAQTGGQVLDHFSWARQPELVVPRLARWMLERSEPQAETARSM